MITILKKMGMLLSLAAVSASMAACVASSDEADEAEDAIEEESAAITEPHVILYGDCGFSGATRIIRKSETAQIANFNSISFNDKTSSLRPGGGAVVRLFENSNFTGRMMQAGLERSCLKYTDGNFNDMASSLQFL